MEEGEGEEDLARRHREEIESGTHQLETLLWASIDKNFDRFEIYVMRNILCLRQGEMEWMRLGHYEGLDFERSGAVLSELGAEDGVDEPQGIVQGINQLRRKLQASQRLQCMLVAEQARNAALLAEMRRLVGGVAGRGVKSETGVGGQPRQPGAEEEEQIPPPPLRFLHDQGDLTAGDAETPLTTTAAFALSQLQALRELSTELRGVMPALAKPDGGEEEGEEDEKKKSWRRERLEYVETATRKHLENVRGLELGENGEVRDGEWDGGGRSLAKGEVESLERVVQMLGGSTDAQDRMDES